MWGFAVTWICSDAPVRIVRSSCDSGLPFPFTGSSNATLYTAMASKAKSDVKVLKGQDGARLAIDQ